MKLLAIVLAVPLAGCGSLPILGSLGGGLGPAQPPAIVCRLDGTAHLYQSVGALGTLQPLKDADVRCAALRAGA